MKHLLLSGERQVGKSTIIQTILSRHPEVRIGGFLTVSSFDSEKRRHVHMIPAAERDTPLCAENEVGICYNGKNATGIPEAFDRIGMPLLKNTACDLIIMDENGHMEKDAAGFQAAVIQVLEGTVPVLGVIKPESTLSTPHTERIRTMPQVQILTVTKENREDMLIVAEEIVCSLLAGTKNQ